MGQRTVYFGGDPATAYRIVRDGRLPADAGVAVRVAARRTGLPDRSAVALRVEEDALRETSRGGVWLIDRDAVTRDRIGRAFQPWHVDVEPDSSQRWKGYLDLEYDLTLVNLVGATTPGQLERREVPFVEYRGLELLEQPVPATFDLAHLRSIHRRLFQDVYPWAGEPRTVNIHKFGGGPTFMAWDHIEDRGEVLAGFVRRNGELKDLDRAEFVEGAAEVYNAVNTLHAFREGNGRTQREWMDTLARGAGYAFDWSAVHGPRNDLASRMAREGDPTELRQMFQEITTRPDDVVVASATPAGQPDDLVRRLQDGLDRVRAVHDQPDPGSRDWQPDPDRRRLDPGGPTLT